MSMIARAAHTNSEKPHRASEHSPVRSRRSVGTFGQEHRTNKTCGDSDAADRLQPIAHDQVVEVHRNVFRLRPYFDPSCLIFGQRWELTSVRHGLTSVAL